MNAKMVRFLNSLNIKDIERFDMDFDLVARNEFIHEQIDMMIIKNTPWEYGLLEEFMEGLNIIGYPYTMSFSYRRQPTVYDAISLFNDWFRSHNRYQPPFEPVSGIDSIIFEFRNETEKEENEQVVKDFKDFLSFLSYNFEVTSTVKELTSETPAISQKKLEKIIEKAEEVSKEIIEESTSESNESYYKNSSDIEEENRAMALEEFNNTYIKELKANLRKVTKEHKAYSAHKDSNSWRDKLPYNIVEDLDTINENTGNVDVTGELYGIDKPKSTRDGKSYLVCGIGVKGKAIAIRISENDEISGDDIASFKTGLFANIKGYVSFDKYTQQLQINVAHIALLPPPEPRKDEYPEKRVELHLHTKMSAMDGVSTIADYCKIAKAMGHKAIAVTDHGVAQAFPEAEIAGKANDIKIIYGCELYMVNNDLPFALNPCDKVLNQSRYVVFDLETTGLSTRYDRITEFGAVIFENGQVVDSIDILINPEREIPLAIQQKTHITQDMVKNAPTIEQVMPRILSIFKDSILVSHNITFDVGFINEALRRMNQKPLDTPMIDTLSLSRYMFPESSRHTLGTLSRNLGIASYNEDEAHRADYDARILNEVWLAMLHKLTKDDYLMKHSELAKIKSSKEMLTHMRGIHTTALVKNREGLVDLYKLISLSHIDYLADVPKTPKAEISKYRKNLLIGTACFNGEIFDAARTRSKEDLLNLMKFYDYVEIQPIANYSHLIYTKQVENEEEIIKYIKDIVEAADELKIPVVVTGDVHYANPEDKFTRDIFIANLGVGKKPHPLSRNKVGPNPDQHYRSTKEMMDIFTPIFGEAKAKEMIITNPNKIADMVEPLEVITKTLHAPVVPTASEELREGCFKKAHELYGEKLPELIEERLNKELDGIISNNFSITYWIAHKIVERAHNEGYMVGSRGSVGSSFAATMYGITEVNPLPPHYRCPHCKHFELVEDPNIFSGYDLPDKLCPVCGEKMVGDGQNIPFQTFLGFNAEKTPDIDLNFPSDYQSKAFDLTKEFFGENNVFRAGTIETVAEKTGFGYVKGYYESKGIDPSSIPSQIIAYQASKCVDVKRTTGQHPGGIVVVPENEPIYNFTPIQYPADDSESDWLTTHLDYTNAFHEGLLKLDLLGHVDPLALRMMSLMTNVDVLSIPLNDQKVISLFTSDKALGRKGNYLHAKTGAAGLPEFGTDTSQDILIDAKPKSFADLVVISGLSHGTDVWAHNAQDLIRNGTCTIREVIGCRDDIMTYLISKGLPNDTSFAIMEAVRKGKGKFKAKEKEYVPLMKAHNVPDWYINSCYKIKYMFPKAHAVAYVTMAVRVGYFKIYYPLEFYAVWFTARCKAYDIDAMLGGLEGVIHKYEEIKRNLATKGAKKSPKDKDLLKMLTVAIEMLERGYTFANIDLYRSDASSFIVDHEKQQLIPPFIVLDGLGEAAAKTVVEEREKGVFTSKEDLLRRTRLSSTNVDDLSRIGALKGLGDSDQMSLFEFGLEFGD